MRQSSLAESLNPSVQVIWDLDFTPMRGKLMLPAPEGQGWTEEEALLAEEWYRRYLTLVLLYPDHPHVPNGPIDAFWHAHILDTRRYQEDCEQIFGYFVHHYPYFGLNDDAAERDAAFDETNRLYRQFFGEDCTVLARSFMHALEGGGCNHAGSGTGCGQRRTTRGQGCNSAGSGTGCGQGCRRG